jgi:predicted lactoylglutathione lyase
MLIFGVEDVDAEVQRIQQQGGEILMGPVDYPDWGYRGAYLRDPDGNLVELLTGLPQTLWTESLREADDRYHSAPDAG